MKSMRGQRIYPRPPVIPPLHSIFNSNKNDKKNYEESLLDILGEKKEKTAPRMKNPETHFALFLYHR